MGLAIATAATFDAITLEEAKTHLRVTEEDENPYIVSLIKAATRYVDEVCRIQLCQTEWDWTLDEFPTSAGELRPPRPPLISVTSLKYYDTNSVQQTLSAAAYVVDSAVRPGRIFPVYGTYWPATDGSKNCVVVRYKAGYATAAAIPETAKAAVRLLVAHYHSYRSPVEETSGKILEVPMGLGNLLATLQFPEV